MCFFLNATSPPGIYSLSLHDALPILATVVFAGWKPMLALAGGVLFGFAQEVSSFATTLPAIGHTFPSVDYIFSTLPYIITLIVVATAIGRSRFPKALGTPYKRE